MESVKVPANPHEPTELHAKEYFYFRFMTEMFVPATDPSLTKASCKIMQMAVMGHRSQPFRAFYYFAIRYILI
jgi:hypothetical protein